MEAAKRFLLVAAMSGIGMGALFSTPAFANKDIPYPSNVSATVSSSPAVVTSDFDDGAPGSTTLSEAVYAGQQVDVLGTWSVLDRSDRPGTDTSYGSGLNITFTPSTTATPGPTISVSSIASCTVTSASDTCPRHIVFDAPTTSGDYQIRISLGGTGFTGPEGLTSGQPLYVNFTVAESVIKLDTKLTVSKQCVLFNVGDVDLTATLEELVSHDPLAGAAIDFYIDPPSSPLGSASTDASGQATLTYNVNGLKVGDHNLYAEYAGSATYNGSNDSNTLGVSYLFVGFQPPINPEGNSIFGNGRVIPIKIRLTDANGVPVTDATPQVWVHLYSENTGLGEVLEAATSVSAADTDNVMRYDPDSGQYIYNWDLSAMVNGTYAVVVDVGDSHACDSGPYYAVITVAKKGGKK